MHIELKKKKSWKEKSFSLFPKKDELHNSSSLGVSTVSLIVILFVGLDYPFTLQVRITALLHNMR